MSEYTPETISNKIVSILEEHTRIIQSYEQRFERLFLEVARIKERVQKVEAGGSFNSNDAKFVADVSARLKAILDTLHERD